MDELSIARAAVSRGLMNERQLQEAREIAEGGRSLLSILFDLGYLRPDDIEQLAVPRALQPAPPRSAPSRVLWFLFGAVPSFFFAVFFFAADRRDAVDAHLRMECDGLRHQLESMGRQRVDLDRQHAAERERLLALLGTKPPSSSAADYAPIVQLCLQIVIDPADMPSLRESALHRAYEAIRSAPDGYTPAMRLVRAQAGELLGQLGAARSDYESALRDNPRLFEAELGLARIDLRNGDIPSSMARLVRAGQLQPGNALVHYWKGRAHLAQDLVDAARKHFEEALAIDPSLRREIRKYRSSE